MKKSFKQCPRCGYVHISEQEQAIFDMMPASSNEISEKLEISKNHASIVMDRLLKLGILTVIEKRGRFIVYDKSEDAFDLTNRGE